MEEQQAIEQSTSPHTVAEARARGSKTYQESSPILDQSGKRFWTLYEEIDCDEKPFDRIGKEYTAT